MSNSLSPTPTPVPTTNTPNSSLEPTTSRHNHERTPTPPIPEESQQSKDTPHMSRSTRSSRSSSRQNISSASRSGKSTRTHSAANSEEQRPTKRTRKQATEEKKLGESQSSYSESSSQGGMGDIEMDAERSQQSEPTTFVTAAPKKKRTRTLTTPHQSAVLQSLLSQSRFPTTAMREEVGRSIGLSARKVQIWFQNQRQKARRPRSSSTTPLEPHSQYGSFSTGPTSAGTSTHSITQTEMTHTRMERLPGLGLGEPAFLPSSRRSPDFQFNRGSSPQLLGPGMPGSAPESRSGYYPGQDLASQMRPGSAELITLPLPISTRQYSGSSNIRSHSPPRLYFRTSESSRGSTGRIPERDFSRTLPPLIPAYERPSFSAPGPSRQYPTYTDSEPSAPSPFDFSPYDQRSPQTESRFAHQLPDYDIRHSSSIPPPFTLQPQPHWEPTAFSRTRPATSYSRPGSSTYHSTESSLPPRHYEDRLTDWRSEGGRFSSISQSAGNLGLAPISPPPDQHSRMRRYDPVHSTVMSDESQTATSPPTSPEVTVFKRDRSASR